MFRIIVTVPAESPALTSGLSCPDNRGGGRFYNPIAASQPFIQNHAPHAACAARLIKAASARAHWERQAPFSAPIWRLTIRSVFAAKALYSLAPPSTASCAKSFSSLSWIAFISSR